MFTMGSTRANVGSVTKHSSSKAIRIRWIYTGQSLTDTNIHNSNSIINYSYSVVTVFVHGPIHVAAVYDFYLDLC